MSAKIFSAPDSIKQPNFSIDYKGDINEQIKAYEEDEKRYIEELIDLIQGNGYHDENAGEIIRFPVADGYAQYMVLSMEPLRLIHLPLGDAWDFEYVHLLTAKEVQEKVDSQKVLDEMFGGK